MLSLKTLDIITLNFLCHVARAKICYHHADYLPWQNFNTVLTYPLQKLGWPY
jgi:hypothetical protein